MPDCFHPQHSAASGISRSCPFPNAGGTLPCSFAQSRSPPKTTCSCLSLHHHGTAGC